MTSNRKQSTQAQSLDDGSGRVALIGLFIVLALLFASVKLIAQENPAARGASMIAPNSYGQLS